jgi:peptide subunit release factor 1 (eRF1)
MPRVGESDGFAGYDAGHRERHIEALVKRYFRQLSDTLLTTFQRQGWDLLALGCRDEYWGGLQDTLHPYLKQRLIGRFLPTEASREPVLKAQLTKMLDSWEQQQLEEVKHVVLNDAHRAGKGAVGLRHVLRSLEKGEVQCLLLGDQFTGTGGVCVNCGHIDLKKSGACTLCGQQLRKVEELADAVLGAALRQNVEVMFVKDDAQLAKVGHIAAQLRFRAEQGTMLQAAS